MSGIAVIVVFALCAYVLGSIPTGLWLGLWLRGVDIRQHGSKNIGATNTMRVLGKPLGAAALAFDMAKGLIPVCVAAWISSEPYIPLVAGVAAICGHTFSVFLRFNGGKGVATSTGVFLGLAPLPTLLGAAVFAIVVAVTRMVSAGSVLAAIAMAIAIFIFSNSHAIQAVTLLVAGLVVYKHRSNIGRILRGEENRI